MKLPDIRTVTVSTAVVCNHLEKNNPTFQHAVSDATRLSLKMTMKFSFILYSSSIQNVRNQSAKTHRAEREHFAVSVSSVTNAQKKINESDRRRQKQAVV